jgi:hypothetical protein
VVQLSENRELHSRVRLPDRGIEHNLEIAPELVALFVRESFVGRGQRENRLTIAQVTIGKRVLQRRTATWSRKEVDALSNRAIDVAEDVADCHARPEQSAAALHGVARGPDDPCHDFEFIQIETALLAVSEHPRARRSREPCPRVRGRAVKIIRGIEAAKFVDPALP